MSNFARAARGSDPQFAVENDRASDRIANSDVKEVARIAAGAGFVLAVGSGVGIVLQLDSQACRLHQLGMKVVTDHRGQSGGNQNAICFTIDQARNRYPHRLKRTPFAEAGHQIPGYRDQIFRTICGVLRSEHFAGG